MASDDFFEKPKIWPFRPPFHPVFWKRNPKNGLEAEFYHQIYDWIEFHRNRARSLVRGCYYKVAETLSTNLNLLTVNDSGKIHIKSISLHIKISIYYSTGFLRISGLMLSLFCHLPLMRPLHGWSTAKSEVKSLFDIVCITCLLRGRT